MLGERSDVLCVMCVFVCACVCVCVHLCVHVCVLCDKRMGI